MAVPAILLTVDLAMRAVVKRSPYFHRAHQAIVFARNEQLASIIAHNHQGIPAAVISVDRDWNLSSFSPELLGAKSIHCRKLQFGNIAKEPSKNVISAMQDKDLVLSADRRAGWTEGGGAPRATSYFEGLKQTVRGVNWQIVAARRTERMSKSELARKADKGTGRSNIVGFGT